MARWGPGVHSKPAMHRLRQQQGEPVSPMGAVYRHTTTEMEARVLQALDTRLALVVEVVESTGLTGQ